MLTRFRGVEIIKKEEELINFKSDWNKNKLKLQIDIDILPINIDLIFIDQIKTNKKLKQIPKFFYEISPQIYQKKLVTTILVGGLGNRLFQISVALDYAIENQKVAVIALNFDKQNAHSKLLYRDSILKLIPIVNHFPTSGVRIFKEKPEDFSSYQKWPPSDRHILFDGYFQSFAYTQNILLKKYFNIPIYSEFENFAFVHVRRGDYLTNSLYIKLSRIYYLECLYQIRSLNPNIKLIVVSDDMKWCLKQSMFSNIDKWDLNSKNELESFSILSSCLKGSICSNSTFAWWGSWFNKSPIQFIPPKWLNNNFRMEYASLHSIIPKKNWFLPIYCQDSKFQDSKFHQLTITVKNPMEHFLNTNHTFALFVNEEWKENPKINEFFNKNIIFDLLALLSPPILTEEGIFQECPYFILSRIGASKIVAKEKITFILL